MTHCERVLELLSDGREHSHHELYALNVVAHSRVAELRKRGHKIEQRRVAGDDGKPDYIYQLRSLREPEPRGLSLSTSPSVKDARQEFDLASGAALPPAPSGSRSEGGDVSNPNVQADQASQPSPICKAPSSLDPSGADGVGHSAVTSSASVMREEGVALRSAPSTRAPDAPEQLTLDVAA